MGKRKQTEFWDSLIANSSSYLLYYHRLMELAISMFEWKNVPDSIDTRFLELCLFGEGYSVFFEDEVLGYLSLQSTIGGELNVYRIPTRRRAYATNGYQRELTDKNSVLIFNNELHTNSMLPILDYSMKLWDIDRAIIVNAKAQKTPIAILCNEKQRLSLKQVYEQYEGNQPFIFGNDSLDLKSIQAIKTDAPYVADKLYQLKTQIWNEALTYLGISNTNMQKKERMLTDEVIRNMGGTIASRYSRLNARKQACEQINKMFGLDIDVQFREDYREADDEMMFAGETGDSGMSALAVDLRTNQWGDNMAKYTTELRTICESMVSAEEPLGFDKMSAVLRPQIVNKVMPSYPIFDESYRYNLNRKIIQHYYTREIGEETYGLWKLRVAATMQEIMPYYNQLYKSELEKINPLYNLDYTTTRHINTENSKNAHNSTDGTKQNVGTSDLDYGEKGNDNKNKTKGGTNYHYNRKGKSYSNTWGGDTLEDNANKDTTVINSHKETIKKDEKENTDTLSHTTDLKSGTNRYSDTPQGGLDGMKSIKKNLYLTNATLTDDNQNTNTKSEQEKTLKAENHDNWTDNNKSNEKLKDLKIGTNNSTTVKWQDEEDSNRDSFGETFNENGQYEIKDGFKNRTDDFNEIKKTDSTTNEDGEIHSDYFERVIGYKGNKCSAEMLMLWRKTFLNIDMMIIKELEDCFFQLW